MNSFINYFLNLFFIDEATIKLLNDIYFPIIDLIIKIFLGYLFILYLRRRNYSEKIRDRLIQNYLSFIDNNNKLSDCLISYVKVYIKDELLRYLEVSHNYEFDFRYIDDDFFLKYYKKREAISNKQMAIHNELGFLLKDKEFNSLSQSYIRYNNYYLESMINYSDESKNDDFFSLLNESIKDFKDGTYWHNELIEKANGLVKDYITDSEFAECLEDASFHILSQFMKIEKKSEEHKASNSFLKKMKFLISKYR
jgi:hypothetical protein